MEYARIKYPPIDLKPRFLISEADIAKMYNQAFLVQEWRAFAKEMRAQIKAPILVIKSVVSEKDSTYHYQPKIYTQYVWKDKGAAFNNALSTLYAPWSGRSS